MKFLEILFPPKLPSINIRDLYDAHTFDYLYRMSRRGVEHNPNHAVGRLTGPAKPRRVFHMPARTW